MRHPARPVDNVSIWKGFSGCWFSAGFQIRPTSRHRHSLKIAAHAAVIATLLGRRPSRWPGGRGSGPFSALVFLTLVVPEIVIAVASRMFFVQARNYVPGFPALGK